jgi:hypothetical protein
MRGFGKSRRPRHTQAEALVRPPWQQADHDMRTSTAAAMAVQTSASGIAVIHSESLSTAAVGCLGDIVVVGDFVILGALTEWYGRTLTIHDLWPHIRACFQNKSSELSRRNKQEINKK